MKIKKVYLKNFKGIKDKKIIEFENQTSLLIGPNGFGKTTIYDAIELCLTDEIHRTITNESVTHHRKDYKKLFFQNDENEDVIIKVWLEKKRENKIEYLIITKYLSKDKDKRAYKTGRKHKPDDFYILKTYVDNEISFASDSFNPEEHKELTDDEINNFFDFDSPDINIKDIYNLFNYLQQDETTFFLKQSESERRNSLSFLFNTNKEEVQVQRISTALRKLGEINRLLKNKIDAYKKVKNVDEHEYTTLFLNKEVAFDKEVLFENNNIDISINTHKEYLDEIQNLITFIKRFSPEEYQKKQNIDFLDSKIKNDEFINYYILHKLIQTECYDSLKAEFELKEDKFKLKAFILQHHIGKYQEYKIINGTYEKYDAFLKLVDFEDKIENIELFVVNIMPKNKENYFELINHRKQLISTTNDTESLITEIIQLRDSLKDKFKKYKEDKNYDATCPYCGFTWNTYQEMDIKFNNKEEKFKKSLIGQSKKIVEIEKKLTENYVDPIIQEMLEFKENNKIIDKNIMNLLGMLQNKKFNFTDLTNYLPDEMIWKQMGSYENLENNLKKLVENIEGNMLVSSELFKKIRSLLIRSYDEDIKNMRNLVSQEELDNLVFNKISRQITIQDLKDQADRLKLLLEEKKKNYIFEDNKVKDDFNFYEMYFQSEKERFEYLKEIDLERKRKYVNYVFSQNQSHIINLYKDRQKRLDAIIKNMQDTKNCLDKIIKKHKMEMANNIKIPFYIYTAKILQNYQQGMGIFLSIKDEKDAIRFLTDTSSDHDAIHHLSSGQLAVTSIAFTLAINKTYNISKNLKFLVIDDPIQEMDSMNTYSFIELIRHEFLNDYQLIFSTHNDINALFMKYRFEKMNSEKVSLINVQSEFFY